MAWPGAASTSRRWRRRSFQAERGLELRDRSGVRALRVGAFKHSTKRGPFSRPGAAFQRCGHARARMARPMPEKGMKISCLYSRRGSRIARLLLVGFALSIAPLAAAGAGGAGASGSAGGSASGSTASGSAAAGANGANNNINGNTQAGYGANTGANNPTTGGAAGGSASGGASTPGVGVGNGYGPNGNSTHGMGSGGTNGVGTPATP